MGFCIYYVQYPALYLSTFTVGRWKKYFLAALISWVRLWKASLEVVWIWIRNVRRIQASSLQLFLLTKHTVHQHLHISSSIRRPWVSSHSCATHSQTDAVTWWSDLMHFWVRLLDESHLWHLSVLIMDSISGSRLQMCLQAVSCLMHCFRHVQTLLTACRNPVRLRVGAAGDTRGRVVECCCGSWSMVW